MFCDHGSLVIIRCLLLLVSSAEMLSIPEAYEMGSNGSLTPGFWLTPSMGWHNKCGSSCTLLRIRRVSVQPSTSTHLGHFRGGFFQTITCTATDNQTRTNEGEKKNKLVRDRKDNRIQFKLTLVKNVPEANPKIQERQNRAWFSRLLRHSARKADRGRFFDLGRPTVEIEYMTVKTMTTATVII